SIGYTVSWNGLSLTARITYKFGYYFQRQSINYTSLFSTNQGHSDYTKRWQKTGDEKTTNVPSMVYPANSARDAFYQGSETLVDKGDNVRLQYVSLSYAIPMVRNSHDHLKNINLYLSINDLGIVWKANKDGIDPDYRNGVIPPSKSFVFGLRAAF
ncbi:MAG: SusC/RagA family TonB-linked outer membrane protein, partial [Arachidicoccus sp.]|nr:SusC/RagA family TonB-linked outer membrane protein [Arachidicoccus sp.]